MGGWRLYSVGRDSACERDESNDYNRNDSLSHTVQRGMHARERRCFVAVFSQVRGLVRVVRHSRARATHPVLNSLVCKYCLEIGLVWKQCPSAFLVCQASAELAAAARVDEPRMVSRYAATRAIHYPLSFPCYCCSCLSPAAASGSGAAGLLV